MSETSPPYGAATPSAAEPPEPTAAISYAWGDAAHQEWVKTELAARLWTKGVRASLDRWDAAPGFSLPHFMEGLVRSNRFALVVCTPSYKTKADAREGGVGYETELMTAARLNGADQSRFIAILRQGDRTTAVPAWMEGRVDIDLRGQPGDKAYEDGFAELLRTLHGYREQPPPLGPRPFPPGPNIAPTPHPRGTVFPAGGRSAIGAVAEPQSHWSIGDDAVRIVGLSTGELRDARTGESDGTAPITLSINLSRPPTTTWAALFSEAWDNLRDAPHGHRPGIARVVDRRIVLTGTTARELRDIHRASLDRVLRQVNEATARMLAGKQPE